MQVLPDAVHRGGHGFNDSFLGDTIEPVRAPLDTLFDVDHLLAWASSAGAILHTVRSFLASALSSCTDRRSRAPHIAAAVWTGHL